MKLWLILVLIIFLFTGCNIDKSFNEPVRYSGNVGQLFYEKTSNPSFNRLPAIESSIIYENNTVYNFYDYTQNGNVYVGFANNALYNNWTNLKPGPILTNARFPYTLKYNETFYTFGLQNDGNIYLWKSSDKINWQLINNGLPVLTKSNDTLSIWHNIWNVGACVDSSGKFHILVECGTQSSQADVGLGYSWGIFVNDQIDFDVNKSSSHMIPGGGNPWMQFIPERNGILFFCGINSGFWRIEAGTVSLTDNLYQQSSWKIERNKFCIETPNIHVCDPHLTELQDNEVMLIFSYNQNSVYIAFANYTLLELYDLLE